MQSLFIATLSLLATTSLTAASAPAEGVIASTETDLEQRLEELVERMEKERINNHIPGFALAVVKDDEVILSKGFGLADVENNRAVEPDTIFAIGSTTKAFTASVIGMLQDEGTLNIDDPVTKYLPYFDLPIDSSEADAVVTLRDLLCHRTGFTRMTALWAGSGVSRELILKTATNAEPWSDFRENFHYNNVMFLAAGEASAAAAKSSWEELIRTRIFTPLGMQSSSLSTAEAQEDERLALGYEWNEDTQEFDHKRMLELSGIAPAGSINSNVVDMAQWLRFQLGSGAFENTRLISEAAIADTWTSNIDMGGNSGYGLGWMLHGEGAERIIEHGGNIDGFGAQVAFMPETGMGFVLLTNVSATPLQNLSMSIVFDTLLKERSETATSSESFEKYVGLYDANFGPFKNAEFEVLVQNGNLSVDVPGQTVYELHLPDEEDKRYFRLTDTIAISFTMDEAGQPTHLKMYQSGMTFELPRQGVEIEEEIPLAEFEEFVGSYSDPSVNLFLEVLVQNKHLAVDVPGQMIYELHVPDSEGKRQFRVTDTISVLFNRDENGTVSSLTMLEPGGTRKVPRVRDESESAAKPLPTLDEFFKLYNQSGRARLLAEHGSYRSTGTVKLAQSGIEGTYVHEVNFDPPSYFLKIDLGEFGSTATGSDGKNAWSYDSLHGFVELTGKRNQQTVNEHPTIAGGDWRKFFDTVSIVRRKQGGERNLLILECDQGDLPTRTMLVDESTGLIAGTKYTYIAGSAQLPIAVEVQDYRDVEGVPISYRQVGENSATGRTIMTLTDIELGVELDPDFHKHEEQAD